MEGTILDKTIYDARCQKPIEGEGINVIIDGFNANVHIPREKVIEIFCGRCGPNGVERGV